MPAVALAAGSLLLGVASYTKQQSANREARRDRRDAAAAQEKIQEQTRADNAAQAASERRQQIREERVRRAKILQSAQNTGSAFSSGEAGAVGTLSTNLNVGLGTNAGAIMSANNRSIFAQSAADSLFSAQGNDQRANQAGQLFSLSGSLFNAAGGFGAFKGMSIPGTTPQPATQGVLL